MGQWIFNAYQIAFYGGAARRGELERWNGRVFIVTAFCGALTSNYMIHTRGTVGGPLQHLGTATNGLAIMICATIAARHAIARRIGAHQRWALRTFLVVNGVWLFRVGFMFWLAVNQGPVGFDAKTFSGPFLIFLAFAEYLLPLVVLEGYLRMRDGGSARGRYAMAGVLVLMTAVTGLGTATATVRMWLPRM